MPFYPGRVVPCARVRPVGCVCDLLSSLRVIGCVVCACGHVLWESNMGHGRHTVCTDVAQLHVAIEMPATMGCHYDGALISGRLRLGECKWAGA